MIRRILNFWWILAFVMAFLVGYLMLSVLGTLGVLR